MVEAVYQWAANILFFSLFMTAAGSLLPSGKYEKYLTEAEQKNDEYRACADAIVAEERYFAPEDLAVGEEELKQAGFTDEFSLWYVRERLLMDAAERKIKNEKAALIRAAKESE